MGKYSGAVQVFRTSAKVAHDESRQESDNQTNFALYIGMIAENEKYLQKMLKKICRYQNLLYLCNQKQQTTPRKGKRKYNNKNIKAMKTTNNTIFENIHERGYMTEREMLLLKNRSNKAQKDLFNYDLDIDGYGIKLDEEWANKGLNWLKSLIKKNGEPKAGQNLGDREIEIIKTATASDFTLVCFYDAGNGWHRNYIPVYNVAGMEYYVNGGFIQVVG